MIPTRISSTRLTAAVVHSAFPLTLRSSLESSGGHGLLFQRNDIDYKQRWKILTQLRRYCKALEFRRPVLHIHVLTAHRRNSITVRSGLSLFLLSLKLACTISYRPDSKASAICWVDSIKDMSNTVWNKNESKANFFPTSTVIRWCCWSNYWRPAFFTVIKGHIVFDQSWSQCIDQGQNLDQILFLPRVKKMLKHLSRTGFFTGFEIRALFSGAS